ncbi:MAG: VWA domain-containing protein [Clostridia bacterium]|nr:VWA domain-containing protein [Clostridia bacterium]
MKNGTKIKNENGNGVTEIVFILDRSGSMSGLESDTIGGFNAMIDKQKKQEGAAVVTTVLFDTVQTVLHDRVPLSEIKPMTDGDYCVGGCTALYDAIGSAVQHISTVHKYARKEDVPEKTMFVITTDGLENSSREYSAENVRSLIKDRKKLGWEFIFIGANIDSAAAAEKVGISADRAVNYIADGKGTRILYDAMSDAVCCLRKSVSLEGDWKKSIDADFKSRR